MAFTDRLHNRGSISTASYDIANSCKFEPDNTEYLTRTPSSDGDRQKFSISLWVKRTELGSYQTLYGAQPSGGYSNSNTFQFCFTDEDKLGVGLQTYWVFQTNRVFRDTSAWYHILIRGDTTQPFSHNRVRLYVNGTQDTSFSINALSSISEDELLGVNHTTRQQIGSLIANSWHSSNYIAEINLIDGQSHAPSYFGEFDDDTGIWKPKEYTGTYGTNGFYLNFDNAAAMGADSSGNNNTWTLNNITSANQATDTPTNNFCILNANSALPSYSEYMVVTEGGTLAQKSGGAAWANVKGSIGINGGKWYWEATRTGTNNTAFGIVQISDATWGGASTIFSLLSNGRLYGAGTSPYLTAPPSFSFTDGDTVAIALDLDNQRAYLSKNGVWQNSADPANGTNPINLSLPDEFVLPWTASYYSEPTMKFNFGGYTIASISSAESDENGYGTFEYAPPSGFYALCTKNLAEYG